MANNILAKMAVQISANTAEFNKALAKTSSDINKFTSSIQNIATGIVAAFSVQQVASFGFEVAKLAGEAEAVSGAFRRLPNATRLMIDLKEATGNTVSELDLMKRAVQASNFDISLAALPRLLQFATLRAQQTGQSVDYLVDSIVTGIGRKSKLILDNLGISAVQLTEALGGASAASASIEDVANAVGSIAEKNLANMASFSQNASTAVQQLGAAWDDLKVSVGNLINATGLPKVIKELADIAKFFAGDFTLTKDQLNKTIIALNELREKAKLEGNQEAVIKYTKGIADLTAQYGLLRDKAIEPTVKKLEEQESVTKKITDSQRDLNSEIERMGRIAKFDRSLEKPKNTSAIGTLVDPESLNDQINKSIENLKRLPENFKTVAQEMINISGMVAGGIADIANAFGEAAAGGGDFGKNIIRSLASFAQQFGSLLIATGIAEIAFKKFSGPAMIAAGAALVALGGAVRQTVSKRSLTGGGGSGSDFPQRFSVNDSFQDFQLSTNISGTNLGVVMVNQSRRDKYTKP